MVERVAYCVLYGRRHPSGVSDTLCVTTSLTGGVECVTTALTGGVECVTTALTGGVECVTTALTGGVECVTTALTGGVEAKLLLPASGHCVQAEQQRVVILVFSVECVE